jgi:hypothetical protein
MSAALLEWMAQQLSRAQHQFGHATQDLASRQAQWEVNTLETWRQANPVNDEALVAEFIHPLTLKLRRQYEYARQSQEHRLIEWQLQRLANWTQEAHAVEHAPAEAPVRARCRMR